MEFHGAYIDRMLQRSIQCSSRSNLTSLLKARSSSFRIQITDAPRVLSVVTDLEPTHLPLSYDSTQLILPMCVPGADPKDEKIAWETNNIYTAFKFVDPAGGVTLYQKVNITGVA